MNGRTDGIADGVTLLMGKDFLGSWVELPRQTQKKVIAFIDRFNKNPQAHGHNLERVENADGRMYSARIDQKYRVILALQKESGVYVLLHADNHDAAYRWAATRRIGVNHHTNTLQVYDADMDRIDAATRSMEAAPAAVRAGETPLPDCYAELTADDLLRFGVPDIYVPLMLRIRTREQFDEWSGKLPSDARVYLQLIAEGQSKTDVAALLEDGQGSSDTLGYERDIPASTVAAPNVDEDDFRTALASYATQQNFVIVNGEDDLRRILGASLDKWRVFLHPSQRAYAERGYRGPFRLMGGAGTGKTVVAMHRAKHLAANLVAAGSSRKVLFTTFSTTLATDIQANLRTICTGEEMRRIDVLNLDRFVSRFLKANDLPYQIVYEGAGPGSGRGAGIAIDEAWARAREAVATPLAAQLTTSFLKDEWRQVVVPRRIDTKDAYLRASRRGRGTRLTRAQRLAVWETMDAYRQIMRSHGACDIDMAMDMVGRLLERSQGHGEYAHVIVDEGQDFSAPAYRILRALVEEHPDDMFIVGDTRQRIYGRTVVLSHCGINIQGRARRLKINYRTTEQIRDAADRIFDTSGPDVADDAFRAVEGGPAEGADGAATTFDDLDGHADVSGDDSRSLVSGPTPLARRFATRRQEMDFVKAWLRGRCLTAAGDDGVDAAGASVALRIDLRDICVVARSRDLARQWTDELDREPYGARMLGKDADDRREEGVRVATMHRVKGLEFDHVILVDVDDGICPPRIALESAADEAARREVRKEERSLIYVALTRARREAMLLGCGAPLEGVAG